MKKHFTKSKTLPNVLQMLDGLIAQHGDTMSVPMVRVDQEDGLRLYSCSLPTSFLQSMICRLPRSLENPDGIQRALIVKKIDEIKAHLDKGNSSGGRYGFPNAVVITLASYNSPYVRIAPLESGPDGEGSVVTLTVSLRRYRDHLAACKTDGEGYLLSPESELLGFMIDGHHRTEGAYEADRLDYPFLTGVYLDLDRHKMAESFAEINCNQEKPSAIHTNAVYNLAGLMTEDQNIAFEMIDALNGRPGLFCNRVKMFDGPRGRKEPRVFVSASKLQKLLEAWLKVNTQKGFGYSTFGEKMNGLEYYFEAWRICYPEAWDSNRHVLTKTMGIDIVFDLYGNLCDYLRALELNGRAFPTTDDFVAAIHTCFFEVIDQDGLAVYVPAQITLNEETRESILLTWESATFGGLSSGKGIHFLKNQLHNLIGSTRSRRLQQLLHA